MNMQIIVKYNTKNTQMFNIVYRCAWCCCLEAHCVMQTAGGANAICCTHYINRIHSLDGTHIDALPCMLNTRLPAYSWLEIQKQDRQLRGEYVYTSLGYAAQRFNLIEAKFCANNYMSCFFITSDGVTPPYTTLHHLD